MKLGLIGLDSSHAVEFSRILNDKNSRWHIPDHPVIAAYPGEVSMDFPMSRDRMKLFTDQVVQYGVKLYPDIKSVMERVDAVFLEQVDARKRLMQFEEIVRWGKPVFVDKPFALNLKDCHQMLQLAEKYHVPLLSTSSLRFAEGLEGALARHESGSAWGADFFGPMPFTDTQPGYFWYGVHMADMLFYTLGAECVKVRSVHTEKYDLITGIWSDGRIGTIRGNRCGHGVFGGTVFFGQNREFIDVSLDQRGYYECLAERIIHMFDTGQSPVSNRELAQVMGFLEAANESLVSGNEVCLSS